MSPYDRPGKWFVLHTQSGYEKKVKQNLEARTESMNMEGRIHEVVIPTREIPEFKNGKKVITEKKLFPGYLLVRCALDDDTWYVIRNTPGVTGFVNQGGKPSPMRRKDVESFLGVEADRQRALDACEKEQAEGQGGPARPRPRPNRSRRLERLARETGREPAATASARRRKRLEPPAPRPGKYE